MIDTYSELKTRVADYLLRAGDATFNDRLPELIAQAEQQIERQLRVPELEAMATLATTAATQAVNAPVDILEALSATLLTNPPVQLDAMEAQALDSMYGHRGNGSPRAYTLFAKQLLFGPIPDGVYSVRFRYYKRLPRLSDAAPTNDILSRYWDLYLYGTLLAAAPTLGDDARIQTWGTLYTGAFETAMQVQNASSMRSSYAAGRANRMYGKLS